MNSLENNLWTWLRNGIKQIDDLHINRIESYITKGIPDLEGCYRGRCFWIELKASMRPVRCSSKLLMKISQEQIIWAETRIQSQGMTFLLLRIGCYTGIKTYLLTGDRISDFNMNKTEGYLEKFSILSSHKCNPIQIMERILMYMKNTERIYE